MLELQNLYRSFRGIPAIENVSFKVAPGEIVGFLGPNGAGKSTTVKIITGMLRPNEGRVLFEGQDVRKDMVAFRGAFGYVPGRGPSLQLPVGAGVPATGGPAARPGRGAD